MRCQWNFISIIVVEDVGKDNKYFAAEILYQIWLPEHNGLINVPK
jgi:hypothetical protein